jgi:8-oxo-dGTP pyrophosphatase MutT (NUDIX family)
METESLPIDSFPELLSRRLKAALPGREAQLLMAPRPRRLEPHVQSRKPPAEAAVLVLTYPHSEHLYIVLTQRTAHLASHSSQISLPGGRTTRGETVEQGALREAKEELALPPECVRIIGRLTPLPVFSSNHLIHPVVAWAVERPAFVPNPQEVEEILEIPLHSLAQSAKREIWHQQGIERDVPYFQFQDYKIWGATAMVLSEFLSVIDSLPRG